MTSITYIYRTSVRGINWARSQGSQWICWPMFKTVVTTKQRVTGGNRRRSPVKAGIWFLVAWFWCCYPLTSHSLTISQSIGTQNAYSLYKIKVHQKIGNLAPFCYCLVVRMGITVLKSKYCMVSKSVTPPSFPLFTQVNLSLLSKIQAFEWFFTVFTPRSMIQICTCDHHAAE